MSPIVLRRLRDKFWPVPLPHSQAFEGQTILITGGTAGLGLAAAIHFAKLGASVAITSRSLSQGYIARHNIEQCAHVSNQGKIHVFQLDLSLYSSCVALVTQLKETPATRDGIHVAILNAGIINSGYFQSPEGW